MPERGRGKTTLSACFYRGPSPLTTYSYPNSATSALILAGFVEPGESAEQAVTREEARWFSRAEDSELQVLQSSPPPTVTVWFDSQQLTRQMDLAFQLNGVVASESGGGQVVVNFTRYGVPVDITAPPPSDTLSYQQFMQMAGQQGGS